MLGNTDSDSSDSRGRWVSHDSEHTGGTIKNVNVEIREGKNMHCSSSPLLLFNDNHTAHSRYFLSFVKYTIMFFFVCLIFTLVDDVVCFVVNISLFL